MPLQSQEIASFEFAEGALQGHRLQQGSTAMPRISDTISSLNRIFQMLSGTLNRCKGRHAIGALIRHCGMRVGTSLAVANLQVSQKPRLCVKTVAAFVTSEVTQQSLSIDVSSRIFNHIVHKARRGDSFRKLSDSEGRHVQAHEIVNKSRIPQQAEGVRARGLKHPCCLIQLRQGVKVFFESPRPWVCSLTQALPPPVSISRIKPSPSQKSSQDLSVSFRIPCPCLSPTKSPYS
jgi:hypothetical protein